MPGRAQPSTPEDANAFASLLASIASQANRTDGWDDTGLADDTASISYEPGLHSQRDAGSQEPVSPEQRLAAGTNVRKTARITIRMTEHEQAQLQEWAAVAHMSISTYLRSCIFEAESLRAQVKEALSQMRAATVSMPPTSNASLAKPARKWHTRLFPRWSRRPKVGN